MPFAGLTINKSRWLDGILWFIRGLKFSLESLFAWGSGGCYMLKHFERCSRQIVLFHVT